MQTYMGTNLNKQAIDVNYTRELSYALSLLTRGNEFLELFGNLTYCKNLV